MVNVWWGTFLSRLVTTYSIDESGTPQLDGILVSLLILYWWFFGWTCWGFWGIIYILMLYSLQKVCDIYINYNLPLVVLFPPGIFYLALLSLDSSILNQLCYIMHRYKAFLPFYELLHYNFIFIFQLYNKL